LGKFHSIDTTFIPPNLIRGYEHEIDNVSFHQNIRIQNTKPDTSCFILYVVYDTFSHIHFNFVYSLPQRFQRLQEIRV